VFAKARPVLGAAWAPVPMLRRLPTEIAPVIAAGRNRAFGPGIGPRGRSFRLRRWLGRYRRSGDCMWPGAALPLRPALACRLGRTFPPGGLIRGHRRSHDWRCCVFLRATCRSLAATAARGGPRGGRGTCRWATDPTDGVAGQRHDRIDIFTVDRRGEGDRGAGLAGAPGTADPIGRSPRRGSARRN